MKYPSSEIRSRRFTANPQTRLWLLLTTLALLALGVVMVHSAVASVARPGPWYSRLDVRHTVFAALAVAVLCAGYLAGPAILRLLKKGRSFPAAPAALLVGALVCGVLVFVPGVRHAVGGRYRWLRIGPAQYRIGFQPSELIKLSLVIFLAAWLTRKTTAVGSFRRTFLPAMLLIGLCIGLVVTQDFGTAVLIGASAGVTLLLAGVPWYYLAALVPLGAGAFGALMLHSPHRLGRILAVLDPWSRINPSAYQPRQSLLSIFSGGWFGKGIGNSMHKLGYLPEAPTDFIFSIYCEEWGFAGAMLLMGLLAVWIWHARKAAVRAEDRFGYVLAGSLGFLIGLQAVLHIAVDLVVAPPTGITLPFVSAGGTALVLMAAAAALVIAVASQPSPRGAN